MKLQDLILHNLRLKLFALLIAVLLWVTIHLATTGESKVSLFSTLKQTNSIPR
jgi:hypothetical protein